MIKRLFCILIPTILFLPLCAFAGNSLGLTTDNNDLFALSNTAPSVVYLSQLFGTVGNTLHSSSGQLLGHIFKLFNVGIMVIAGLTFMITIISTVIYTAQEGKFMGAKQAKPEFMILRTVLGFGMLVPMASGYSLIQILTMSVILHGVGFANSAWNIALDYFNDGGVLLMPPATNTSDNINLAGTVLQAQVCMYHQEKNAIGTIPPDGSTPKFVPTFTPQFVDNSVRFPSQPNNIESDAGCGELTWDAQDASKNQYMKLAMQQVIYDTQMAAKHIVFPDDRSGDNLRNETIAGVVGAAADWIGYTLPARNVRDDEVQQYLQKAKDRGWLYAGAYYVGLTSLQSKLDNEARWQFKITQPIYGLNACSSGSCDFIKFPEKMQDFRVMLDQKADDGQSPTLADHYFTAASYISYAADFAKEADKKMEGGSESVITPDTGETPLGGLIGPVISKLNSARHSLYSNSATNMDPILQLQAAGNFLMDIMTIVWIGMAVVIFGISSSVSVFSFANPYGYAFRDMLNFFLPLFMTLCVVLFVQGMVMAVYIPMIPFIIYTFSVMGWFAVCVEAMVAAPLVAMGLAHHEGHDMWGRSEEAIWLLLDVFLRPILMVIGLLSGMLLSRIGLKYLDIGFAQVIGDIHKASHAFAAVAELMMFIILVTTVVHVSYGLIHRIPDKVMRWLRSSGDQMGEFVSQATRGSQDTVTQVAQERSKMGSSSQDVGRYTSSAWSEVGRQSHQRSEDAGKQQMSATGSAKSSAGSGGGGSGGGGGGGSSSGSIEKPPNVDPRDLKNLK